MVRNDVWTTCPLSCHNPTWNALGKRTVPCTFFSSKSRLQWEQIVIAQDSVPLVRMTSSSRLLILNGSKLLNKSSSCEIAWESLMVWKLETCLTLQKIGKHRRQSAGAWQTADPVPDPSTVQSTRPQWHQKMSTRFIKARTFQHLFVPHKTHKPFVFVEAANEMLALNLVSESDLLNTLMLKRPRGWIWGSFMILSLVGLVWPLWKHFGRIYFMSFISALTLTWTSVLWPVHHQMPAPNTMMHTVSQHFPTKCLALCSVAPWLPKFHGSRAVATVNFTSTSA